MGPQQVTLPSLSLPLIDKELSYEQKTSLIEKDLDTVTQLRVKLLELSQVVAGERASGKREHWQASSCPWHLAVQTPGSRDPVRSVFPGLSPIHGCFDGLDVARRA
jgi:hypothetical protein